MGGFKEFISRGNVVDLAVAVIIGAAFTAIVTSLTSDVIMPVVGWLMGDLDFSSYFILLGTPPAGVDVTNYEALKAAGVPMLGYGQFITAVVNFLIVAFIIYMIVKMLKRMTDRRKAEEPVTVAPAPDAEDIVLLREIRDALRARGGGAGGV
jgi:large conductance mechanosensitive channel